jgi:hypothetical protein
MTGRERDGCRDEVAGVVGGRVVRTPDGELPYKVILQHEGAAPDSEHPVATVRQGEVLIRHRSPSLPRPESRREYRPRAYETSTTRPSRS